MKDSDKKTRLMRSGRSHEGWVNVPPTRASTYVFPTVEAWRDTRARRENERLRSYGARGTDSTHALEDILIELEGGFRAALFPTGQAAIAVTLLGFLSPGDHLLMTDAAYEPVRRFCSEQLNRLDIEVTYYLPDGSDLKSKIQKNTKVIYVECPGSLTYDMLDLKDVSTFARQHHCVTIADNTWGSGWLYRPLELGADVSIIAATKYLSGHSDVMMGVAVSNKEAWPLLQKAAINFGQAVGADDAYLVSRGIRTLPVRMSTHEKNALIVAQWLKNRKEVSHVFCPALSTDENHQIWQRDCKGTNGLLTVEFHPVHAIKQIEKMIDALSLFGLGASWGGFESLVIPANMNAARSLTDWTSRGQVVRFHIGLEDPVDLIKDLEQAFKQFHL